MATYNMLLDIKRNKLSILIKVISNTFHIKLVRFFYHSIIFDKTNNKMAFI